jgi:hypothetical protein
MSELQRPGNFEGHIFPLLFPLMWQYLLLVSADTCRSRESADSLNIAHTIVAFACQTSRRCSPTKQEQEYCRFYKLFVSLELCNSHDSSASVLLLSYIMIWMIRIQDDQHLTMPSVSKTTVYKAFSIH